MFSLKTWSEALTLILLSVVLGIFTAFFHPKAPPYVDPVDPNAITMAEALQWGDDVLWVDARTREEYEQGHIPGAILLNEYEWDALLGELLLEHYQQEARIIVYCGGGTCEASRDVAERLSEILPGNEIRHLLGGYPAWKEQ